MWYAAAGGMRRGRDGPAPDYWASGLCMCVFLLLDGRAAGGRRGGGVGGSCVAPLAPDGHGKLQRSAGVVVLEACLLRYQELDQS